MRSVPTSQIGKRIEGYRRSDPRQAAQQGVLARRMLGISMKFAVDTEIGGRGEPVDFVYEVENGAVRTVKVLPDGRRNVGGFYFAGDIFGFEDGNDHSWSAEAIVAATIRVIKRKTLVQLTTTDGRLAEELVTNAMAEATRAHCHALLLVMTSQERVNSFLAEMAERISIGDLLPLPMSRRDIADYLGLTVETVSREIRGLASTASIHIPDRRNIVLRDRSALGRAPGAQVQAT